jgi:hypothetical protein
MVATFAAMTKTSSKKYVPRASGMMPFETVSIDEARATLDELPPDVAAQLGPKYWEKTRRAPLATDRALTGRAMEWLGKLPADLRPQATMQRYPRIVNSIAAVWNDPTACDETFEHLLNDRRRGRRGFPIDIEKELSALCLHASGPRR